MRHATPSPRAKRAGEGRGGGTLRAAFVIALLAAASARADDGPRIFQRCYACHSVEPQERDLSGPNLDGVVGRRAAALPEFDYSEAMRAAGARGLVWTPETLDRYLADPEDFIAEGRMQGVWLRDAGQRRILIEWLSAIAR